MTTSSSLTTSIIEFKNSFEQQILSVNKLNDRPHLKEMIDAKSKISTILYYFLNEIFSIELQHIRPSVFRLYQISVVRIDPCAL